MKKNKFPINYLNYHVSFPFEEFMIDNKKVFEIIDNNVFLKKFHTSSPPHNVCLREYCSETSFKSCRSNA